MIIGDLHVGRSPTEIIKFIEYQRSTVYDIVQKYAASDMSEESSANPARKIHSKKKTAKLPAVVQKAQELISEDSRTLFRKLVTILEVSDATMRRIAEKDLRYTSYVIKVRQMLF